MERWKGKVAVVTGASVGVGRCLVEELARRDLIVVGLARRHEIKNNLPVKSKGSIHAIKCDLSKESDIMSAFEWVTKNMGGVDILINNAGVVPIGSILEGRTEAWRNVLDVNVLAASICAREAVKTMRKRGDDGYIININSVLGHAVSTIPSIGMYSASKFALRALSDSLRVELEASGSSIKVTNVSPGLIHTDMSRNVMKGMLNIDIPAPGGQRLNGYLDAQDVVDSVINVLSMKPHVQVMELTLKPLGQPV